MLKLHTWKQVSVLVGAIALVGCSSGDAPKSGRDAGWALTLSGDGVDEQIEGRNCTGAGGLSNRLMTCIKDGGTATVTLMAGPDATSESAVVQWRKDNLRCSGTTDEVEVIDDNLDSLYFTASGEMTCDNDGTEVKPTFEFYYDRGK